MRSVSLTHLQNVMKHGKDLSAPANRAALTAQIFKLEETIKSHPQETGELRHFFGKDVYARELVLQRHTLIVGAIHKHPNLNIISRGSVTFFSTDGAMKVRAPFTFVASPGVKRVIFAHTKTVWTTIHGTSLTDLDAIRKEFIADDYDDVDGISLEEKELIREAKKCLGL